MFFGEAEEGDNSEGVDTLALAAKSKMSPADVPDHRMVEKWIIDSGCGHDLVARMLVISFPDLVFKVDRPITFNTANGLAPSTEQARIGVKELGQVVKA